MKEMNQRLEKTDKLNCWIVLLLHSMGLGRDVWEKLRKGSES